MIAPGAQRIVISAELGSPAVKAIEDAQKFIREKDVKKARESLQVLATNPNISHPEVLLAELVSEAGFEADGRAILEELSGKEPARVDLYLAFCERAVRQQRWFEGWNLANLGLAGKMPEQWSSALKQQVTERLQLLKGVCCEGRKDWRGAKDVYSAMEQNERNGIDRLAGLGRSSFHLGDKEAALGFFESLKKLNPKSEPPYMLMAQLNDLVGNEAEAEASYKMALQWAEGTDRVAVRLAFARWLIVHNRPEATSELLGEPISVSAENETERQFLQALIARMEGRYSDAQAVLSALHRQDPSKFVIGNQLALVLCESTDESLRARALQIAEGNVRNSSQSSEAWATLGWVQFQLGDRLTAERSFANAAQLGPLSRDTIYYILQLKRAAGDIDAATILERAFLEAKGPNFFAKKSLP